MSRWLLAVVFVCVASVAMAQQKQDPAAFGLDLAIQQAGVAAALFSQAVQRALAERDTRIAELEKLCGDPCKAKVQETK